MVLEVTRAQVMAYRAAAHGLDRRTKAAADLAVLDLGVQSAGESARLAVAARLADVPRGEDDPLTDDETFALLWSFRGAPHLHRRADLPGLVSALWPLNEADAMSRLPAERAALRAADMSALDAFSAVARALRSVVTRPLSKGEVSAAVTARLPEALSYECRPCQAVHVYVGIFQQAGLFAGVRHVPDQSPLTLVPLEGRPRIPTKAAGTTEVLRAYLRLHGPATLTDAAGYLGTTGAHLRSVWPDDAAQVSVDGRRCWILPDRLDLLRDPPPPTYVRLLPAYDPLLQGRDRAVLVPDPARRKQVWRILGNPGVVFVDGEITGTWRARAGGRTATGAKRLTLTIEAFGSMRRQVRAAVEDEAARMALARGVPDVQVSYE